MVPVMVTVAVSGGTVWKVLARRKKKGEERERNEVSNLFLMMYGKDETY